MKNEVVLDNIDENIYKHIIDMWKCARLNNSTIPDDLLDEFKMILMYHYDEPKKNKFFGSGRY